MTGLYGTPKVGADILSYCTRCRMELAHVVVSMLDGNASKVHCKTCQSVHKHRGAPGTTTARKKGTRKAAKPRKSIRAADLWEQRMASAKSDTVPYQVNGQFTQGDLINHVHFGIGIVEEVRDNSKILVLFRQGEKILIHGRS